MTDTSVTTEAENLETQTPPTAPVVATEAPTAQKDAPRARDDRKG